MHEFRLRKHWQQEAISQKEIVHCYEFVLKVVGSLKSESTRRFVGTATGYLFQTNEVLRHKTSPQAHARLVNYTLTSVTLQ